MKYKTHNNLKKQRVAMERALAHVVAMLDHQRVLTDATVHSAYLEIYDRCRALIRIVGKPHWRILATNFHIKARVVDNWRYEGFDVSEYVPNSRRFLQLFDFPIDQNSPDTFTFTPCGLFSNVEPLYTSGTVDLSGLSQDIEVSISLSSSDGSTYAINGGEFTTEPGYIKAGDTVVVNPGSR